MVYWGCATGRNRCVWFMCIAVTLGGSALFFAGAGHMWVCNHESGMDAGQHRDLGTCKLRAGMMMALGPLVVLLAVLPSLLFFQSCMALAPPRPVDWDQGVPSSGITVVRRTANGPAVYHYDAHGKLISGPDCFRHMNKQPPSPGKAYAGPAGPHWPTDEDTKRAAALGIAGSYGMDGIAHPARLPRLGQVAGGQHGSESNGSEAGTAEVYISLNQLRASGGTAQPK